MTLFKTFGPIMPKRSLHTANVMRGASIVLAVWMAASSAGYAQSATPFGQLAGSWSGNGTIELANGAREPLRCHASYDVLEQQNSLQLNIRCASDSYNFNLRGSANYAAGAITGTWSESSRNAAGTIAGKADGDRLQVLAKGPSFSATLTLVTRGDRQSVEIESQDAQTSVKGASITLQRG